MVWADQVREFLVGTVSIIHRSPDKGDALAPTSTSQRQGHVKTSVDSWSGVGKKGLIQLGWMSLSPGLEVACFILR